MKESVYLESTVLSYLTAKPSRDIISLARQEITREVWPILLTQYDIFVSEIVQEEISRGDPKAASKRIEKSKAFPFLEMTDEVESLTITYIEELDIPDKALRDASHIAIACIHKIDYLVTWNCTHIANAHNVKKLYALNRKLGIHTPVICTPSELAGGL